MLKNSITKEETSITEIKFKEYLPENKWALGKLKDDPALFAYFMFRDVRDNPFKMFTYQDLIVNDPSKRVLLCISRQTGKSTIAAIKAIHTAFFNNNYTVLVVSRTKDQSIELIRKIKVLMQTSKIPWKNIQPKSNEAKTEINIKNLSQFQGKDTYSRIISVPATDAARGFSADLLICDECAFWENGDYIFNQVVEPTTRFTKGKIMLLSTPNGRSGFFWNSFNSEYWSRYQFGWDICPINTDEEMEECRQRMTKLQFASEYEAKFVSSQNSYLHPDIINKAVRNLVMGSLAGHSGIVVGVDFGKVNDQAVIFIGKIENPKDLPQDQTITVIDLRVKPLGTNYAKIIGELKWLHDTLHPDLFVLDATGVGEGPSDVLREYGARVEAIKFSIQKKADIFSNMKIFFEQGRIRIPDNRELRNQLELFEYEYTASGNMKLHAPDGEHDDYCDSLCLMVWGLSRARAVPVTALFIPNETKRLSRAMVI